MVVKVTHTQALAFRAEVFSAAYRQNVQCPGPNGRPGLGRTSRSGTNRNAC